MTIALPAFNNLGHLVTPIPLLIDHFLYCFSTFHLFNWKFGFFTKYTIKFHHF